MAVGREGDPSELFFVEAVEREWKRLPIVGDPDEPLIVFAIGAGECEAVRPHRDVVRPVEWAADGEDGDEFHALPGEVVLPDLAGMRGCADVLGILGVGTVAAAAHEPDGAVESPPRALELWYRCRAIGPRLLARRGVAVTGVRVWHRHERNGQYGTRDLDLGKILNDTREPHGGERPAAVEAAASAERLLRLEAIEASERTRCILGQEGDAIGCEGHRLVLEAAHGDDGGGISPVLRVHFEHIAVR